MLITIIVAFIAFNFGFFVAGLMAEARRNDNEEENRKKEP